MVYGPFSVIFLVDNKILSNPIGERFILQGPHNIKNATTKQGHPDCTQLFVCRIWLTLRS